MLVLVLTKYTFFQKKKDPAAAGSFFSTLDEISIMILLYHFYHSYIFLFLTEANAHHSMISFLREDAGDLNDSREITSYDLTKMFPGKRLHFQDSCFSPGLIIF